MPLKKIFSFIIPALLLLLSPFPTFSTSSETQISIIPSDLQLLPGGLFTVDIWLSNVEDLCNWQVVVKYNGTIASCTSVWIPENDVFAGKTSVAVSPILNERAKDGYDFTVFGSLLLSGSVNVSEGLLFRLNFTAQTYGLTPILIATEQNPVLHSNSSSGVPITIEWFSMLLDSNIDTMPFSAKSGSIQVGPTSMLTVTAAEGGTTVRPAGLYSYAYGENVSVEAVPNSHYALDYWLLDDRNAGTANPTSVLMTENHTLQPVFVEANFTLTISDSSGGNTNPPQGIYRFQAQEITQVFASASADYRFEHWIFDNSATVFDDPITIVMNTNHSLEAVFSESYYTRTIYIRPNGAVDPSDVPISIVDDLTYVFTGDISDSIIVVQRSNITIEGANHILQGGESGDGISLYGVNNVTLKNLNIRGFDRGISIFGSLLNTVKGNNITMNKWLGITLYYSSNNTIVQNNVTQNNDAGIRLEFSSNWNTIVGNSIMSNKWLGIYVDSSEGNLVHHNNWISNTNQVYIAENSYESANQWDDGLEGNYWSNYISPDSDHDGIVDAQLVLNGKNLDRYPLAGRFHDFTTSLQVPISLFSNSTIESFHYSETDRRITFNVKGLDGTRGYCSIIIQHGLMNVSRLQIIIDDDAAELIEPNYNLKDNTTHRWIYFAYEHSTRQIVIQEDNKPPSIVVISPENRTYTSDNVSLTFTVDELTAWKGCSLDGKANITIFGNLTLTSLIDGQHYLIIHASDSVGNMGKSDMILFATDTTPPDITSIIQIPSRDNVTFSDEVEVNATVIDEVSKMKSVTLFYECLNTTAAWNNTVEMKNVLGNSWTATIPAFPDGTNVTYVIIAEDNVGHNITTKKMAMQLQYHVVPEFVSMSTYYFFIIALLLVVMTSRRWRRQSISHHG